MQKFLILTKFKRIWPGKINLTNLNTQLNRRLILGILNCNFRSLQITFKQHEKNENYYLYKFNLIHLFMVQECHSALSGYCIDPKRQSTCLALKFKYEALDVILGTRKKSI